MNIDRESGIGVLGNVRWGTHFCVFYRTEEDLADILVPYFEAGLENNEYCIYITSEPLSGDKMKARMARAIPDFDERMKNGQIEIMPYQEWYVIDGKFDPERVLSGWVERLQKARARGFSGLRLAGNTFWLEKDYWKDFQDYERELNDVIGRYDIIAMCAYSLDKCDAAHVLEVANTHQFVMSKLEGAWNIVEGQEQKKVRKVLQESDVRFRSLIQNSSDIIRILDKDGRIIFDSPSSVKILGYPPDYLLGRSPLDFIHPDDRERVRKDLSKVYARKNPGTPTEFRMRKADGEYLDVESIGMNMVGVPGVDGIVITTRPITERKRAEERLRMLSRAVEDSPATVVVTDIKGNIEYVNPKFTQLTGYTFEEAMGENPRILKSGKTSAMEYKRLWKTILSGEEWRGEFLNKKKNGELYWESAIISPIRGDKGEIAHFVAVKEDITERKRMERELTEAKERAELYLDLMSHDINNLNQVAMGYLELANETLALDNAEKELVSKPLEALASSSTLIDNVRKLQQAMEGGLKTDNINLKELLSKLMGEYSSSNGRAVTINLEVEDDCHVRANGLLHDVFANLIGNAIKHSTESKHLEINIKLDKSTFNDETFCRVAVEDNGPGVPDSLKGKLFNRFQRGKTKAHGKGLGLYLVRSLVDDFHGEVLVEDRVPGDHTKGARFVVMLPALE